MKPDQFADLNALIDARASHVGVTLKVQKPSRTADLPLERQHHLLSVAAYAIALKLDLLAFENFMGVKLTTSVVAHTVRFYWPSQSAIPPEQARRLVEDVVYEHAIAILAS